MMPMYHQQQPTSFPNGFQFGYQQQQQQPVYGFWSKYDANNYQQNQWTGRLAVNGHSMPLLPPPPFYYPIDMTMDTVGHSNYRKRTRNNNHDHYHMVNKDIQKIPAYHHDVEF